MLIFEEESTFHVAVKGNISFSYDGGRWWNSTASMKHPSWRTVGWLESTSWMKASLFWSKSEEQLRGILFPRILLTNTIYLFKESLRKEQHLRLFIHNVDKFGVPPMPIFFLISVNMESSNMQNSMWFLLPQEWPRMTSANTGVSGLFPRTFSVIRLVISPTGYSNTLTRRRFQWKKFWSSDSV